MATPQTRSAIASAAYYVAAGRRGSMAVSTAEGVAAIRALARPTWLSDRVIAEMIARCAISCGMAVDFDLLGSERTDKAPDDMPAADICAMLPDLRLAARMLTREREAADDLVEETLSGALATVASRNEAMPVEQWLFGLLCSTHERSRVRHLN